MPDTPLTRARDELHWARERVLYKDTPTHRQAVVDARAHLDDLLDEMLSPTNPEAGDADRSPASVPSLTDELMEMDRQCQHGDTDSEDV